MLEDWDFRKDRRDSWQGYFWDSWEIVRILQISEGLLAGGVRIAGVRYSRMVWV
jgi:hypothetical protein